MHTTPISLLEQLRGSADPKAWARLVTLYTPLIYYWARRTGLQEPDAADLVQDVFALLIQKLPEFTYDRQRSFRGWLRTVTLNKWRENARRRIGLPMEPGPVELDDMPDTASAEAFWDDEYRQQLVGRALELMRTDFQEPTWKACWQCIVEGRGAEDVAASLGMTAGAVRAAKFRVLTRLRQELAGMLD